jgi:hypothetical protein
VGLAVAWILVGAILVTAVSWNRALQVDEVEHVHAAFLEHRGLMIYRDFWQAHNPLLYVVLTPLVDEADAAASFHRARSVTTLLLFLTVGLVAYVATRLGGWEAGLLAAGLALHHTTLVERGMEVRPDGPLALCTMAALALRFLPGKAGWRWAAQGAVLGAGFLFTQKGAFACLAFGLLWVAEAFRKRRLAPLVIPMAAWLAVVGIAFGAMAMQGNFEDYWSANIRDSARVAVGAADYRKSFGPGRFLVHEGSRNVAASILFLSALVLGPLAALRSRGSDPLTFPSSLALLLVGSLWANPFPFPYLHPTVLPMLVVLAAAVVMRPFASRAPIHRLVVVCLVFALAAPTSLPRLISKAFPQGVASMDHQLQTVDEVHRVTSEDDAVFDMLGLTFRPNGYRVYSMTGNAYARYRSGGFPPMVPALRQSKPVAVIWSYRTQWLEPPESEFLREHFVHHDGNVLLLGTNLSDLAPGTELTFEVLKAGSFRFDGSGTLLVDGQPFLEGWLEEGPHRLAIERDRAEPARLIRSTPPPVQIPARPPEPLFINFD